MKVITKKYIHPTISIILQERFPKDSEELIRIGEIYKGMYNCHPYFPDRVIFLYHHNIGTTVLSGGNCVKIIGKKKDVLRTKINLEEKCGINLTDNIK
ncbi:MAG: hypothetical protein NTU63_04070 [Candidatus Pacearchaeota archaeon]|nr:hypothetical protein [Candidatus Pacearchaeota archaeon]